MVFKSRYRACGFTWSISIIRQNVGIDPGADQIVHCVFAVSANLNQLSSEVVAVVAVVVVLEGWGSHRTFGWRRYKISSAMIISSSHLGSRIDLPRSECGRVITGRMNGCDSCGVELGRSGSDLSRWRPVDALMMWTQRS